MIENIGNIDRIIQESVPGKQITLAHMIAAPIQSVYESLGVEESGAIGILSVTPYETSIIAADIAAKSGNVDICFIDRFTGSVIFSGDVQSVRESLDSIVHYFQIYLEFSVVKVTQS